MPAFYSAQRLQQSIYWNARAINFCLSVDKESERENSSQTIGLPVTSKKTMDGEALMLLSNSFWVLWGFHSSVLSLSIIAIYNSELDI